jgi:hypothetical protein
MNVYDCKNFPGVISGGPSQRVGATHSRILPPLSLRPRAGAPRAPGSAVTDAKFFQSGPPKIYDVAPPMASTDVTIK